MGWLSALPAIASGVGSIIGGNKAADAQSDAAKAALRFQKQQYGEAKQNFAPYMGAGSAAIGRLSDLYGLGGDAPDMSAFYESPDYQFRLDQGRKALEGGAAARGGLYSGAMGKALQDYGQSAASQEFGNFYNRLFGLSEQGRSSVGALAGHGSTMAANAGNLLVGSGDARASSYANQANQLAGLATVIGGSDWYKKMTEKPKQVTV